MKKSKWMVFCCLLALQGALSAQTEAPAVKPGGADIAYAKGDFKRAVEICRVELQSNPRNWNALFYLCQSSLQVSTASCMQYCKEALTYYPGDPALKEIYGAALYYSGQSAAALREYQYALKQAPGSSFRRSVTWYHVGLIYSSQGKYLKAIPAFKRAVSLNPWNIEWQKDYGFALEKAQLTDDAIAFYRRYLANQELPAAVRTEVQQHLDRLQPKTVIEMKTDSPAGAGKEPAAASGVGSGAAAP